MSSSYSVTQHHYASDKTLNVFIPRSVEPIGCILYFHGGAWVSGSALISIEVASMMVRYRYTVVCPNYTLTKSRKIESVKNSIVYLILLIPTGYYAIMKCTKSAFRKILVFLSVLLVILILFELGTGFNKAPVGSYPENIRDAEKSLAWTLQNISVANEQLFLMGHSAGAHIAALLTNTTTYTISGAILLSGIYMYEYMNHPLLSLLRSEVFHDRKDAFSEFHVKRGLPPHLLCSAALDYGLQNQARTYTGVLQEHGVDASHIVFSKNNHYSIRRQWDTSNHRVLSSILSFMRTASNIKKLP